MYKIRMMIGINSKYCQEKFKIWKIGVKLKFYFKMKVIKQGVYM